jgi:hypothetical protein
MPPTKPVKAIVGAVLAGLAALGTALADGKVSPLEIVGILIAVVATGGSVYGVTNPPATTRNQRGAFGVWEALLIALVVGVILVVLGAVR